MSPHPQHSNKNPLFPVQIRVQNVVDGSRKTSIIIILKIFLKKIYNVSLFLSF